jgi:hypothetical protein
MIYSKELLLNYFLTHRFGISTKDLNFFYSIRNITRKTKKITSKQDRLFVHLVKKYCTLHLRNKVEDIDKLVWKNNTVIESADSFLIPTIKIVDSKLYFYMPFNENWNRIFNKTVFRAINSITYQDATNRYVCELTTFNLKSLINFCKKLGRQFTCCDQIKKFLESVDHINKARYKYPTLVKSNGNYYVYALTDHLHGAIKDIPLDSNPATLYKLYQYGITIDKSVVSDISLLNAINKYKIKCNSVKQVMYYIELFDIKSVVYNLNLESPRSKILEKCLKEKNIKLFTEYKYYSEYDNIKSIPVIRVTDDCKPTPKMLKKYMHKTLFVGTNETS